MRDINDQADAIHLCNRLPTEIGKPAMLRRTIAKCRLGPRGIGQIIMPIMRQRQINRAQITPEFQPRQIAPHGIAVFNRAQHRKRARLMRCFKFIGGGAKPARHTIGACADVAEHGFRPISGGLMAGSVARALRRIGNEDNGLQSTALHFREINAAVGFRRRIGRVGPFDIHMGIKGQGGRVDGFTHAASPQACRKPANKSPMTSTL